MELSTGNGNESQTFLVGDYTKVIRAKWNITSESTARHELTLHRIGRGYACGVSCDDLISYRISRIATRRNITGSLCPANPKNPSLLSFPG